jgi:hypothetical protein
VPPPAGTTATTSGEPRPAGPAGLAPAAAPAAPAPASPAAETTAAAIATASIVLRASHAFCEPSLDDRAPSLRARYEGLKPGRHDIYCTMPQGGPKHHVASYNIQPGTRPSLVIVPGPDGRPTLARPD